MFIPAQGLDYRDFGRTLDALIARQGAVLNLHFSDGVYAEYPRILKAYQRGKPLLSEPLSPPLQQGRHYFDLATDPTPATTEALFRNLADLAANHSFQSFLETSLAESRRQKAG